MGWKFCRINGSMPGGIGIGSIFGGGGTITVETRAGATLGFSKVSLKKKVEGTTGGSIGELGGFSESDAMVEGAGGSLLGDAGSAGSAGALADTDIGSSAGGGISDAVVDVGAEVTTVS